MPTPKAMIMALETAKQRYLGGNVHTIGIGYKNDDPQQGECVVCKVTKKLPASQLSSSELIPGNVTVQSALGNPVVFIPTDVVEAPMNEILILSNANENAPFFNPNPQAGEQHRRCFHAPIPGGAQMAPQGAGYVGTLGCCFGYAGREGERKWGALTNWHVAVGGQFGVGHPMMQPHGSSGNDYFGRLDRWADIKFDGSPNYIDAAVIDTYREDGRYAPGTHTVKPEQVTLGRLSPEPKLSLSLGERVVKDGRTTGGTAGRVTLINATSHVNYGNGRVARFDNQYEFRGDSGDLSGPGDSGSLICTEQGLHPAALLFAGGGGTTIGNAINEVIAYFGGKFA